MFAHLEDLLGGDLDVRRHTFGAAGWLMDHDLGIRERKALAFFTCREEYCRHRCRHADAGRRDIRLNVVHGVENGESGRHMAAGGVDIEGDILFRVLRGKEEHLGDDEIGDVTVDWAAEENDALFEQARINVVGSLTERGLFDNHGDQHACARCIHTDECIEKFISMQISCDVFYRTISRTRRRCSSSADFQIYSNSISNVTRIGSFSIIVVMSGLYEVIATLFPYIAT